MVLCREHALDHVLIGAVRGQRREGGADERGPDGVFAFEDAANIFPKGSLRLHATGERTANRRVD